MHAIQLAASRTIQQVFDKGRNLNQALDHALTQCHNWQPAERAALQDLCFGSVRYYGELLHIRSQLLHKPLNNARINHLLIIALYQLRFSRSAQHAVVDHAVKAAKKISPKMSGLVNGCLRNFLRNQSTLNASCTEHQQSRFNHPKWWIDLLQQQYPEHYPQILQSNNQHPPMNLRVNRRHLTPQQYLATLQQHDMAAHLIAADAIQLEKPVPVSQLPGFSKARFRYRTAAPNTRRNCWRWPTGCAYWMPARLREGKPAIFWNWPR